MTQSQPTRQNRKGHPCPPWCRTDHAWHDGIITSHISEYRSIRTGGGSDRITAAATQSGSELDSRPPLVAVSATMARDPLQVDLASAAVLADLIAQLGDATPDQHRELAAAIRQAAAQITEAQR